MTEPDGGSVPVPRRLYGHALVAVADGLRAMARSGCRGFDLSDEARAVLERLAPPGRKATGTGTSGTPKTTPSARPAREETRAATPSPAAARPRGETLADIRADLGDCRRCGLSEGRTCVVFGTGNPDARLMFVGEGPGRDEDLQGEPFVGRAGRLLDRMIRAMGMKREDVYIANVVKCRPPGNRNPLPDEVAACRPFLDRQIRAVGPEVVCALGKVAAQAMLDTDAPLGRLRGAFRTYGNTPLLATYHPAFLLRYPEWKRAVWEDMKKLMGILNRDDA